MTSFVLAVFAGFGVMLSTVFAACHLPRRLAPCRWLFLFSPYLLAFAILALGVLYGPDGLKDAEQRWSLTVAIRTLLLLFPPLCALSIWQSHGFRRVAVALIPLSLLATLGAITVFLGD